MPKELPYNPDDLAHNQYQYLVPSDLQARIYLLRSHYDDPQNIDLNRVKADMLSDIPAYITSRNCVEAHLCASSGLPVTDKEITL